MYWEREVPSPRGVTLALSVPTKDVCATDTVATIAVNTDETSAMLGSNAPIPSIATVVRSEVGAAAAPRSEVSVISRVIKIVRCSLVNRRRAAPAPAMLARHVTFDEMEHCCVSALDMSDSSLIPTGTLSTIEFVSVTTIVTNDESLAGKASSMALKTAEAK